LIPELLRAGHGRRRGLHLLRLQPENDDHLGHPDEQRQRARQLDELLGSEAVASWGGSLPRRYGEERVGNLECSPLRSAQVLRRRVLVIDQSLPRNCEADVLSVPAVGDVGVAEPRHLLDGGLDDPVPPQLAIELEERRSDGRTMGHDGAERDCLVG